MDWTTQIGLARERIQPYVRQTPCGVLELPGLTHPVELKLEQMQHTGSFKARGAFNTLLSENVPKTGVVAASGGNHGAAVAYAAHKLGYRARIYVPEMAGPAKIALIKSAGADLVVVPGAYAQALEQAQAYEAQTGAMQLHAYDAPGTVTGQGTLMAEWEAQGLSADTVLIAVGGGGLIGGAMAWTQGRRKIVAVEPTQACALSAALRAGVPMDVDVAGVAANALGARRIGQICFDLARAQGIQSLTVADDAILQAQGLLWRELRQLVEPAGATALAALLSGAYRPEPDERMAVIVCGANVAPDPLQA